MASTAGGAVCASAHARAISMPSSAGIIGRQSRVVIALVADGMGLGASTVSAVGDMSSAATRSMPETLKIPSCSMRRTSASTQSSTYR